MLQVPIDSGQVNPDVVINFLGLEPLVTQDLFQLGLSLPKKQQLLKYDLSAN